MNEWIGDNGGKQHTGAHGTAVGSQIVSSQLFLIYRIGCKML